jgi:hypothetical protein
VLSAPFENFKTKITSAAKAEFPDLVPARLEAVL